jgi:hypothetical protein
MHKCSEIDLTSLPDDFEALDDSKPKTENSIIAQGMAVLHHFDDLVRAELKKGRRRPAKQAKTTTGSGSGTGDATHFTSDMLEFEFGS